jgi:hypothetical protein
VPTQEHQKRRWPLRLIEAAPSCLFSAIFVAVQIPAVREAIGIANTINRFINSTVPSLGMAANWLGFALIVGGVVATWQAHRKLKDGTTKMTAEGSAVLTIALGVLVAVVSTFNHPAPPNKPPGSYEARVAKHRRTARRHRHHAPAHHPSSSGTSTPSSPSPAPTSSTPTPAPSSPPSAGGSSTTSGGGGGNTVTINKSTEQNATTGNAEGPGATSGPATNNNNESTNISIG